jgi:hypothetical protein
MAYAACLTFHRAFDELPIIVSPNGYMKGTTTGLLQLQMSPLALMWLAIVVVRGSMRLQDFYHMS